jgi:hypothetical protein
MPVYYVKVTALSGYGLDGQKIAVVEGLYARCLDSSRAEASARQNKLICLLSGFRSGSRRVPEPRIGRIAKNPLGQAAMLCYTPDRR